MQMKIFADYPKGEVVMGCDIHAFIEWKDERYWNCFAELHLLRDYELFGHLAGVRGDATPIVQPRGVLSDMDIRTNAEYKNWLGDLHDASWLNAKEFRKVLERIDRDDDAELISILTVMETFERLGNTTRLIFWFDN